MKLRALIGSLCLGATLFSAAPASAQPVVVVGDGLVNVVVTDALDVEVRNVDVAIGVAARIAATVCGIKVGPVAVLGTAIDAGNPQDFVCENTQTGEGVVISQN